MAKPVMSLTLVDAYGRQTVRRLEFQEHLLLAEFVVELGAYLTTLQAVTDLGVVRADFQYQNAASGFAATAGANVDVGATFVGYVTGEGGKKATVKLPGIKPAFVEADGTIDLADISIAAWLDNFEASGDFYISDGESIDTWIKGTLDR